MDGQGPMPVDLRPPEVVMRLERMGAFHPTRLSFMRHLLRRLASEGWRADRPVWEIGADGTGHAVYRVTGPQRSYALVAFAHDLPDHLRSDRVIAEAWDATFALFDGEPLAEDIARLSANVPLQEAGRVSGRELTLSRANRSVRLFAHVVEALAAGRQPDAARLRDTGYLMRTTAVYGSGKFGLSDRAAIADRPEMRAPFQAEMLTVWLIRAFSIDIVEHLAQVRNPDAVRLAPGLRHCLGVGNSTGLGMAPFLVHHPVLIHNWMAAREEALARVRALAVGPDDLARLQALVVRARRNVEDWHTDHPGQLEKLVDLRADLDRLAGHLDTIGPDDLATWDDLWRWVEGSLGLEGQEQALSLLLEPHGALIDELTEAMAADEEAAFPIDGCQTVGALAARIDEAYRWALDLDWDDPAATARLWYVSAEKLEPRLAERAAEPLEPYEQALAPARDIVRLRTALAAADPHATLASFLKAAPAHRQAVRRVQQTTRFPYGEIRDNTIAAEMLPIDMLRAKLSFFGASRFDPRSDRWVRITMFQGAPYPDEPDLWADDDWMLTA